MSDIESSLVDFTVAERRILQFAPFWIFSSLVGHARDFNSMEREALAHCLDAAARTQPGRLGREVLASVDANTEELLGDYATDPRSIASGLYAVAELLDRVAPREAKQFRDMLVGGFGVELDSVMAPSGALRVPRAWTGSGSQPNFLSHSEPASRIARKTAQGSGRRYRTSRRGGPNESSNFVTPSVSHPPRS